MKLLTKVLLYVTVVLSISVTKAADIDYEVAIGVSKHAEPANGLWHQEGFDHEINDVSPTFRVGAIINDKWEVGYRFLGRYSSTALASASDQNYANWRKGE